MHKVIPRDKLKQTSRPFLRIVAQKLNVLSSALKNLCLFLLLFFNYFFFLSHGDLQRDSWTSNRERMRYVTMKQGILMKPGYQSPGEEWAWEKRRLCLFFEGPPN